MVIAMAMSKLSSQYLNFQLTLEHSVSCFDWFIAPSSTEQTPHNSEVQHGSTHGSTRRNLDPAGRGTRTHGVWVISWKQECYALIHGDAGAIAAASSQGTEGWVWRSCSAFSMGTSTQPLLLCLFLLHKACFTCIFAEAINPALSEEVQVSGNKLGCTEGASMTLVRYQENELTLISKENCYW